LNPFDFSAALKAHARQPAGRVYRHLTAVPADAETAEERRQRQAQRKRELRAALRGGERSPGVARGPNGRFAKVYAT
jgi:hypothetical protein